MTYAPATRAFYDADSHIMELPDFLKAYADPALRDAVPEVSYAASIVTDEEVAVIVRQGSRHSPEHVAAQIALGDKLIESSKEIQALGAFNRADRTKALDMLGFKKQLVFATHSVAMPFSASSKLEPGLRYGAARAHNRHMADFCADDGRLIGVAVVPLDDPISGHGRARLRARARARRGLDPAPALRRPLARPRRPRPVLGAPGGRAARRSCCTSAARRCSWPGPG